MNQAVTVRPPLKAVAAALGSLIARRSHEEIVRQLQADFDLDEPTAEQCLEIARGIRRRTDDGASAAT